VRYFPDYQSYRNAWDKAFSVDPPIPLNVDIELSSVCNLKCPFCPLSDPSFKRNKNKYFQVYQLGKIIIEADRMRIPSLKFNWMGEPTLHPFFNEIMEYAASFNFYDLLINTNGNYKAEINKGLMYATKVMFSVDSVHEATYNKMRPGGNRDKVIFNIGALLKAGHKNIVARRVITTDNQDEDFESAIAAIFGSSVSVSEHYVFDRNSSYKYQTKYIENLKRKYCGYPSQRLVIDTDLNVFPCCADYNKNMLLGNIKEKSLMEIWRSQRLRVIRAQLRKRKMPSKSCVNCTSWMAYDSEYRKEIQK